MVNRIVRRSVFVVALLLGVLVAAWHPAAAKSAPVREDSALARVATELVGSGHGARCAPHLSDSAPVGPRSPSWHRGTGRRTSRSTGFSPIETPSGSIPVGELLIGQPVVSFVRSTALLQGAGRSAVGPRAPPAIN